MDTTEVSLHLHQWNLVQYKVVYILTSFISSIALFDEDLKYGDGAKFWGYYGTNTVPLCEEFSNLSNAISL
jgi:hypothetical protein